MSKTGTNGFISSSDIIRACTGIIGFTFASIGFLWSVKSNSNSIIGTNEFNNIVQSLLLVIFMFSIPIMAFLGFDIIGGVLPEEKREHRFNLLVKLTKLFMLVSFLFILNAFLTITSALGVEIFEQGNSLLFTVASLVVGIFLAVLAYLTLKEFIISITDSFLSRIKHIIKPEVKATAKINFKLFLYEIITLIRIIGTGLIIIVAIVFIDAISGFFFNLLGRSDLFYQKILGIFTLSQLLYISVIFLFLIDLIDFAIHRFSVYKFASKRKTNDKDDELEENEKKRKLDKENHKV
ncbi:MAG: hypothetical protein ACFFD4_16565 [Candidatus Odinarchaeota archaeon]